MAARAPQVFIAGGNSGANVTTVLRGEIRDGGIAAWSVLEEKLSASASSTQATRSGNNVFIIGPDFNTLDTHTVRFARFDDKGVLGAWSGQKGAFTPHSRVAAASNAGFIYAIGGLQESTDAAMPSVWFAPIASDGSPGVFSTTKPMPVGRAGACAVIVDNFLYVFGGFTGTIPSDTALKPTIRASIASDGTLGDWQTGTDLNETAGGCSAVAVGKKVFVIGGYGAQTSVQYATAGVGGALGPFTTGPKIPSPHAYFQAVVAGGYVVVAGGFGAGSASSDQVELAPISESTGVGSWTTTTKLPSPRHFVNAFGFD
jgi:hypothetical protein